MKSGAQSGFNTKRPTVVSVASGKGGVGKTLSTVHLALTFAHHRKKVLILDGDFGQANVDVILGIEPKFTIDDVIEERASIKDVILEGPSGIKLIPSSSGFSSISALSFASRVSIFDRIRDYSNESDIIVIDSGAGISPDVLQLNSLADQIVVITTPEPHALTDAYAFIKVMSREYSRKHFNIVVNMTRSSDEGLKVYMRLSDVMRRFLNIDTSYLGSVSFDPIVKRNIMNRQVINNQTMNSTSGQSWKEVALKLLVSCDTSPKLESDDLWKNLLFRKPSCQPIQMT